MEVTKTNFKEVLPDIKDAIANAHFIAIDCELTGISVGSNINAYDTPAQYYEKVRKVSKDFLVIQYGLCIFRYDHNQKKFIQRGYNFYVFPRPTNKLVPDHRFLCQASSIDFLSSQGFDFNKLFQQGIPYLNSTEEDKYREELSDKQRIRKDQMINSLSSSHENANNCISMSADDKLKVNNIFNEIEEFIKGNEEELVLPRCNAFIRRLVYGEAPSRLQNRVSLETRVFDNKDRVLVVARAKSKEVLEEEESKRVIQEEEEFKECVGFAEVIKCIVQSGKLVVGHNMILDILFTIEKFLSPLPENYGEFKDLTYSLFSNIIDTKYMSSNAPFADTVDSNILPHLYEAVRKQPFELPLVEVEEGFEGYGMQCNKPHEAGYDAFITGMCFLGMWLYLGEDNSNKYNVFNNPSSLWRYRNRLFLMRIQDISCIHLGEDEVVPNRDHVIYLTFPKEWRFNDIMHLFSPFGKVDIAWIDEQSAYVGLQSPGKIAIALSTLSQSDTYTVTTYAKRQAQLQGSKLIPYSPRRRSSDNTSKNRRSLSLGNTSARKRSFDTIKEDPAELVPGTPRKAATTDVRNSHTPKKIKKTFNEDTDWA